MKKTLILICLFATLRIYAADGFVQIVSHQIQPGETLFRIALMYNSTVPDIIKANTGLNPKKVQFGMDINVPKDTKVRDAAEVESLMNSITPPTQNTVEPVTPQSPAAVAAPKEKALPIPKVIIKSSGLGHADLLDDGENPFMASAKNAKPQTAQEIYDAAENDAGNAPREAATRMDDGDPFMAPGVKTLIKSLPQTAMNTSRTGNPAAGAARTPVIIPAQKSLKPGQPDIPAQYESVELQTRYMELKKIEAYDHSIQVVDLAQLKLDASMYTENAQASIKR